MKIDTRTDSPVPSQRIQKKKKLKKTHSSDSTQPQTRKQTQVPVLLHVIELREKYSTCTMQKTIKIPPTDAFKSYTSRVNYGINPIVIQKSDFGTPL